MLFNALGRVVASADCRVFSDVPRDFYQLNDIDIQYSKQHDFFLDKGLISNNVASEAVEERLRHVEEMLRSDENYKNIFDGMAIPFCFTDAHAKVDLGSRLVDFWMPMLRKAYEETVAGSYFKAILQGNSELRGCVSPAFGSGYEEFLDCVKESLVIGYYFPTAFQEFDVNSQRARIAGFPKVQGLAASLSGPLEMIYSLISYPRLLFHENKYSPILLASGVEHIDPRMVLMLKSYGPHLEFWLMSQMLSPSKTQVSEQWSGGVTIYTTFK
jgi:hypothetical protein